MSRVITFSRTFPAYHPKAGQPTYFVEKLWRSFPCINGENVLKQELINLNSGIDGGIPKHHTIRAGSRWKVGDKFSPRVWSGKPYNSKQIIIAPDIEVKKVWDFQIKNEHETDNGFINYWYVNNRFCTFKTIDIIAKNDGLERDDLLQWFGDDEESEKPVNFKGQIICWNDLIQCQP